MRRYIVLTLLVLVSLHFIYHTTDAQEQASPSMDIVIALDNSGSMKTNDPELLTKAMVSDFVERLSGNTRISIIIFDEKAWLTIPLTPIVDEDINQKISKTLEKVDYRGKYTNIPAAIERAVYELKTTGRDDAEKIIIFMTDGVIDTGDQVRDMERHRWLKEELAMESKQEEIRIFGIAFTDQADFELIQALAQNTDGEYYRALKASDIQEVLHQVNETISAPKPEPVPEPEPIRTVEVVTPIEKKKGFPVELLVFAIVSVFALGAASIVVWRLRAGAIQAREVEEQIPEAYLVDIEDSGDGKVYEINNRVNTVGRGQTDDIDISLDIDTISAAHAQIEYRDHGFYLTDLSSTNGTYLDEVKDECKVNDAIRLNSGDIIILAKHKFRFMLPSQSELEKLKGETVLSDPPPDDDKETKPDFSKLEEVEKHHIEEVLKSTDWNKTRAAKILGIDRKSLYNKIKKFNIVVDG